MCTTTSLTTAVRFYRSFLSGLVLPHAVFFGYVAGIVELLIGISLLPGLWVLPACAVGEAQTCRDGA